MKKNILYSGLAVMSLALASCNGDYDDWAAPQSNPAENPAAAYGVALAGGDEAQADVAVVGDTVSLLALSCDRPEVVGYSIKSLVIDNGATIDAWMNGNKVEVSTADLEKVIIESHQSKAHATYSFTASLQYSAMLANGDALSGQGDAQCALTTAVTPAVDPNGYYMLGDFVGYGWNLPNPVKMEALGNGVFKAEVKTAGDSNWFKFYEASKYSTEDWDMTNSGQMGCAVNGDDARFNYVVWSGDKVEVQTPVVAGAGSWEIYLDAVNMTYKIQRAEATYYVAGNMNNWDLTSISNMFYGEGNNVYSYTSIWKGEWDLKIRDGKNTSDWNAVFGTAVDGDGSVSGTLVTTDQQSFQAPTKNEYYTLTIDMNSQTYTWTRLDNQAPVEYTDVTLIGDFNGWDVSGSEIALEQVAGAPHNWYVRYTLPTDGGLKFRANRDWKVSWGCESGEIGDIYYLTPGANNIIVPAGTYDFYLNDITGRFNIVKVQ